MGAKILKPGLLTTIQDLGRTGYQKDGVIVGGAMDSLSTRLANMMIGNQEAAPVLEMTLQGGKIEFQENALIAIGGADMSPAIDNHPVSAYRPIRVQRGSILAFGNAQTGCRTYLAVAGGFRVPPVMGSSSTYLRAEIGGFQGRPLKKNDVIQFGALPEKSKVMLKQAHHHEHVDAINWKISPRLFPELSHHPVIRAFRGRQHGWFTQESRDIFYSDAFTVTTEADRMGYRLKGPSLELAEDKNLLSESATKGTIQVPSAGNPIVLMADRQTTGGYPKIAQVATVDLPILAQLKPGDHMTFQEISHAESQTMLIDREKQLRRLKQGIDLKITEMDSFNKNTGKK